jgi:polysaccharide export outer membrane protein
LGDYKQNPFLYDGDVVLVDKVDKTVYITGQVKYPASYEYRNDETVKDLIDLAGGFLYKAKTDSIEVVSFEEDGKTQKSKYYSIESLIANSVKLNKSDQVIVREISEYYNEEWVTLTGKIKYPGLYKIIKDKTTLTKIISEAGGFLKDASLVDAVVFRTDADTSADPEFERIKLIPRQDMTDDEYDYLKAKSRQRKGKVVVDFKSLFENNQLNEDLILKKGDEIRIPEKKNYITLIGQVVSPGNIIYDPSLKVEDYIQMAGGFSWRAIESDVRVIKVNTGEWIDSDDIEKLDPGDTIWVLEDPPGPKFWDVFTTSLTILGQVAAIVAASIAVIIATR